MAGFRSFLAFDIDRGCGAAMLLAVAAALVWANSGASEGYQALRHLHVALPFPGRPEEVDLRHWVNELLMAVFFLQVGLEVRQELDGGLLSRPQRALLVTLAALGGMLVPIAIYLAFALPAGFGGGWGIPMATDIAFVVGLLALVGGHRMRELKVFLVGMAIVDDLGAIAVIAVAYSRAPEAWALAAVAGLLLLGWGYGRLGGRALWPFLLLGLPLWWFLTLSGIHGTLAGVLLAAVVPTAAGSEGAPAERLESWVRPLVLLFIMPLFAFFNAGVAPDPEVSWISPLSLGVFLGLALGKPLGILSFVWLTLRLHGGRLPPGVSWPGLLGIALLAGVGFTMSIFITNLAFATDRLADQARVAILAASTVSAVAGMAVVRRVGRDDRAA